MEAVFATLSADAVSANLTAVTSTLVQPTVIVLTLLGGAVAAAVMMRSKLG